MKFPYSAVVARGAELSVIGGTLAIRENTLVDIKVILRTYGAKIKIGKDCSINAVLV